ncbi:MAG: hypothetical protein PWQ84_1626 [Thermotogaceae bacterium]|jgi:hypothetical protein|nr:hypothetical protein [Thermotogaceae bacterium]
MFLKKTHAEGKIYLQVVQSYRDKQGVSRHKIICNLGRLDKLRKNESAKRILLELLDLLMSDADKSSKEEHIQQRFNWE